MVYIVWESGRCIIHFMFDSHIRDANLSGFVDCTLLLQYLQLFKGGRTPLPGASVLLNDRLMSLFSQSGIATLASSLSRIIHHTTASWEQFETASESLAAVGKRTTGATGE